MITTFIVMSAGAQSMASPRQVAVPARHEVPAPKSERMDMLTPGIPVAKVPRKVEHTGLYYNRPAGMFPGSMFMDPDGTMVGIAFSPYYEAKPYAPYTFEAIYDMGTPDTEYIWDFQYYDSQGGANAWETHSGKVVSYAWPFSVAEMPVLSVSDGGVMQSYQPSGGGYPSHVMAAPSAADAFSDIDEGGSILVSSKTLSWGGDSGHDSPYTVISGIDPYGDNESGYWFGKNGGTVTNTTTGKISKMCVDGIAQAFEKPSHPYVLKQVVLYVADLEVLGRVNMNCKIYRLEEIPPYDPDGVAVIADEPGELIATGHATLTPEMPSDGYVVFTLFNEEDGLEYEVWPTIDEAILVVIDGYNDEGMENLQNFSALICSDIEHDEGFGELAYLKYGILDEDGNLDHYQWVGLNNFFTSGEMMTGLSIFMDIENPFLAFVDPNEDGVFHFDEMGALMYDEIVDETVPGIEFRSWIPSEDDGMWMLWNGEEDLPDWLDIQLIDGEEDGEFNHIVTARVTADPLPNGLYYREAVIRFEIPGAYLDCRFIQGVQIIPPIPCPGRDGEINIRDVNCIIYLILNDMYDDCYDVNFDGELDIADLNFLIDYILEH